MPAFTDWNENMYRCRRRRRCRRRGVVSEFILNFRVTHCFSASCQWEYRICTFISIRGPYISVTLGRCSTLNDDCAFVLPRFCPQNAALYTHMDKKLVLAIKFLAQLFYIWISVLIDRYRLAMIMEMQISLSLERTMKNQILFKICRS